MPAEDYMYVGFVLKLHGFKGGLTVVVNRISADQVLGKKMFFLKVEGHLVPYFVQEISQKSKDRFYVRFDEVNNESMATTLLKSEIYIPSSDFEESDDNEEFTQLQGFKVIDEEMGFIGIVEEIITHDSNPLFRISNDHHEYLVPMHQDLIDRIDESERKIHMILPSGLLDL